MLRTFALFATCTVLLPAAAGPLVPGTGQWHPVLDERYCTITLSDDAQLLAVAHQPDSLVQLVVTPNLVEPATAKVASFLQVCRAARKQGFSGITLARTFSTIHTAGALTADDPQYMHALATTCAVAFREGLGFSAGVLSPCEAGAAWARARPEACGSVLRFQELPAGPDGTLSASLQIMTAGDDVHCLGQGPIVGARFWAFRATPLPGTHFAVVSPRDLIEITSSVTVETGPTPSVRGTMPAQLVRKGYDHVLAVLEYRSSHLDPFHPDAEQFLFGLLDRHAAAGIRYTGLIGIDEASCASATNTCFVSPPMRKILSAQYGRSFGDLERYLIYLLRNETERISAMDDGQSLQYVWDRSPEGIAATQLFRTRYDRALRQQETALYARVFSRLEAQMGRPIHVPPATELYKNTCVGQEASSPRQWMEEIINRSTPDNPVLALPPVDVEPASPRQAPWTLRCGVCDWVPAQRVSEQGAVKDGALRLNERTYRTLVVLHEPFATRRLLTMLQQLVDSGGTVIWCGAPAMLDFDTGKSVGQPWRKLFGLQEYTPAYGGIRRPRASVQFDGILRDVRSMRILSNESPDFLYPCVPERPADVVVRCGTVAVGTVRTMWTGGRAIYLGFSPCSGDANDYPPTLYEILRQLRVYPVDDHPTVISHELPYCVHAYRNGAICIMPRQPSTALAFNELVVAGHRIGYNGERQLCYRLDAQGALQAFGGEKTTGITIDNREYRFHREPISLAFAPVDPSRLASTTARAYLLRIEARGKVWLPIDTTGWRQIRWSDGHEPVSLNAWLEDGGLLVEPAKYSGRWLTLWEPR